MLSTACENGSIYVYDLRAQYALVRVMESHKGPATAMDYSGSEHNLIASGGADGVIKIWDDRKHRSPFATFDNVHKPGTAVSTLLWNPDKRSSLLSGDDDGMIFQMKTSDTEVRGVHTGHPVSGLTCLPQGEVLSSHRLHGHLQLRRLLNFSLIGNYVSPSKECIACFTTSPDRERICAVQRDETLKFWRVADDSRPKPNSKEGTRASRGNRISAYDEYLR